MEWGGSALGLGGGGRRRRVKGDGKHGGERKWGRGKGTRVRVE